MSDISFTGGMWGILGGNQQYTVRAASFMSVANAIGMIWDWGWVSLAFHYIFCMIEASNLWIRRQQEQEVQKSRSWPYQ